MKRHLSIVFVCLSISLSAMERNETSQRCSYEVYHTELLKYFSVCGCYTGSVCTAIYLEQTYPCDPTQLAYHGPECLVQSAPFLGLANYAIGCVSLVCYGCLQLNRSQED
jgi:hypothetical protein